MKALQYLDSEFAAMLTNLFFSYETSFMIRRILNYLRRKYSIGGTDNENTVKESFSRYEKDKKAEGFFDHIIHGIACKKAPILQ